MPELKLSVVIPSYNGLTLLKQSLLALKEAVNIAQVEKYEIIVIDNGSTDKTKEYLKNYKHMLYLKFPIRLGFTKAVNIGIKKAKGKYVLLLNNDCLVQKDTIKKMLDCLAKNKNISFTQPVIKEAGKETIGYIVDLKIGKAFPVDKKGHQRNFVKQEENPFNKGWFCGLSATCLLLKKEAFDKIGLLDESFHSYLEDIDFCFRAVKKGIKFAPCLNAKATHLHMQTSKKMGNYKPKRDFINWIKIIKKHYPKTYLLKYFPFLFIERLKNFYGIIK